MTFGVTPPEVIFTVAPAGVGLGAVESLPPQASAATASTAAAAPSAQTLPGPAEAGRHGPPADPSVPILRLNPHARIPRLNPGAATTLRLAVDAARSSSEELARDVEPEEPVGLVRSVGVGVREAA